DVPEFAADLRDFVHLAATVLDAASAATVGDWLRAAVLSDGWADDFAERMFALGPAAPIALSRAADETASPVQSALVSGRRRERRSSLFERAREWTEPLATRARELAATVRTRFWV